MSKKKPNRKRPGVNAAASVTIDVPAAHGSYTLQMGLLPDAHGTATVEDPRIDTLHGSEVILYNSPPNEVVTDNDIATKGFPVSANPTATAGEYEWSSTDVSAIGEDNPLADNNALHVLAKFDRDIGGAMIMPLDPPARDDKPYKGKNDRPPKKKAIIEKMFHALAAPHDLVPYDHHHRWLLYRKAPAETFGKGHRLLDLNGNPLKASEVEVYAFGVNWTYTDFSQAPPTPQPVTRPTGDKPDLSTESGPFFLSPLNSLIIWNGDWHTRRRAVVVSQSKRATDVPKFVDTINLDPTKDIFIHMNFHRVKPLRIEGTFGLAVRVKHA